MNFNALNKTTLPAIIGLLGGGLVFLWHLERKTTDSTPQAESVILSNPNSTNQVTAEFPLQLKNSNLPSPDSKHENVIDTQSQRGKRVLSKRIAISLRADELAASPKMLLEPGVLWGFKDLVLSSLAPDMLQSKPEGDRLDYIGEVILAFNEHIRTLDQEVIRLESVILSELEQAKIDEQRQREKDIRMQFLSKSEIDNMPFSSRPRGRPHPGARPRGHIEDLHKHRIKILELVRRHLASYSQLIRNTPRIREIPVTKELFPE